MKVYIVTDGSYSDYTIERVFSNREAAEEYKKWHNIRYNEIEEYEIYDEPFIKEDGEQAVLVRVHGLVFPEAIVNFNFETSYRMIHDYAVLSGAGISSRSRDGGIGLYAYHYVPVEQWDEDKWRAKMTKVLYDYAAMAKDMFADGATMSMVDRALSNMEVEYD